MLDSAHVAFLGIVEDGQPFVLPMVHVRLGNDVVLHGAPGSRILRALAAGTPACLTVCLLDGLVLARSAAHHSLNYRSAVLLGRAREVTDPGEKLEAMRALIEHMVPGRWEHLRPPDERELLRTMICKLPIDEASAKLRTGGPIDDEADLALGHWAGVLPMTVTYGEPVSAGDLAPGIDPPEHARTYRGPGPAEGGS